MPLAGGYLLRRVSITGDIYAVHGTFYHNYYPTKRDAKECKVVEVWSRSVNACRLKRRFVKLKNGCWQTHIWF